jgi:uncharacterized membrane protein HdeD (DUF308 family)
MVGDRLLGAVKGHAGVAVGVGITLILAGVLAICAPFVAGLSVMVMIGAMLVIAGVALALLAFRMRVFGPGLPFLLMGGLMIVTGLYMAGQPVAALMSMTVLLSIYLIVSGIVEFFSGIGARPDAGWGWMVASGAVTLLLGIMLWRQFPLSGVWAIGTLFGIKLLMTGFSMTSIGAAVRQGARKIEGTLKS